MRTFCTSFSAAVRPLPPILRLLLTGSMLLLQAWPLSGLAVAQDVCAQAVGHVASCSEYCQFVDSRGCQAALDSLASNLTEGCDPQTAESVLNQTCGGLGQGVASDVCNAATEHIIACLTPYCESSPSAAGCTGFPDSVRENAPVECSAEMRELSQMFLDFSCDDVASMLGL